MVLETYFMHIDNTYNKLQTLTEYIDDTEVFRLHLKKPFWKVFTALQPWLPGRWLVRTSMCLLNSMVQDYINIELDNQRNQLIRVSFVWLTHGHQALEHSGKRLTSSWRLQIELVLTAATFAVAIIGSIAGIFGMNLNNGHEVSTAFCAMLMLYAPWLWHAASCMLHP